MLLHLIAKLLQYRKPSTNGYKNVHNSVNIIKTENDKVNHVHCMGGKYYPKIKMHDWTMRVLGKNKLNDKVILTSKAKKKKYGRGMKNIKCLFMMNACTYSYHTKNW